MIAGRQRITATCQQVLKLEKGVITARRQIKRTLLFKLYFQRTSGEISQTEDGEDLDFVAVEHYYEIL